MQKDGVRLPYKKEVAYRRDVKIIEATKSPPWQQDSKGYFLIRINREKNQIEVGFCETGNVVKLIIVGKTPEKIYHAIFKEGLVTKFDHAAYLGKELEKAYIALETNSEYIQDSELIIEK